MKWVDIARRAGISTETLFRFRKGARSEDATHAIERALEWQAGSVDAILHGSEPTPITAMADTVPETERDKRISELQAMASELIDYAERLKREIERLDSE